MGSRILSGLHLLTPLLARLLAEYPWDYLYGCISADIFIGKGRKRRDNHCHNWSIGQKMLARVREGSCQAFTFGYLSHLAADIIAHNFYVPNQLYLTPFTSRVGHLYWELVSDRYIEDKYWTLASEVLEQDNNRDNDRFLQEIIPDRFIPFRAKKGIYTRVIKLYDLGRWQRAVKQVYQNGERELSPEYIKYLLNLSLALIKNFLHEQERSLCLRYDPVGRDNLAAAKRMRRVARRSGHKRLTENIFTIPHEIHELINHYLG